ncbi:MAG: pyridoxamine 5'-phosphate oxidase family protein [Fibrobacter sp.]|nr:pyridoxamine 5'-phosphate oxidase family protein [Fibrobacter sp.]
MNKEQAKEKLIRMLHEHDFGVLATSGTEYPYTSLVTIYVSDDCQYLLFPTLRETHKYANLCRDIHVSVLLDNRSIPDVTGNKRYAISVLGIAHEVSERTVSSCKERFLGRHPNLGEFLSKSGTALVQVTFNKIILVEEFGIITEFECPIR